jgi:hypothetical protein
MEYSVSVGMMVMCEALDINKRLDHVEEIAVEASKDAEEVLEMRKEMIELGAEMTKCQRAMILLRNELVDVVIRRFSGQCLQASVSC